MPMAAAPADVWPDTTADAVWRYLEQQNFKSWPMWPGKTPLYKGVEPHGALLTTYVNALAQDALTSGAASMPANAIIVKENYMPDSTLAATTVIYKRPGYDAPNNDWYWMKRLADGTVEASGRVEGCVTCHGTARLNDFIMTGSISSGGTRPRM
jgi:hypothetical protein